MISLCSRTRMSALYSCTFYKPQLYMNVVIKIHADWRIWSAHKSSLIRRLVMSLMLTDGIFTCSTAGSKTQHAVTARLELKNETKTKKSNDVLVHKSTSLWSVSKPQTGLLALDRFYLCQIVTDLLSVIVTSMITLMQIDFPHLSFRCGLQVAQTVAESLSSQAELPMLLLDGGHTLEHHLIILPVGSE